MAAPATVWSAVIGYAQTLALEVGPHNINVNTLMSGYFDTPLIERTLERQPELSKARLGSGLPMGRIGEPREFADLVGALVSPHLRFGPARWFRSTTEPVSGWAQASIRRPPRSDCPGHEALHHAHVRRRPALGRRPGRWT
ncbi:SDR family oxidoreductase [Sphaerisporangium sp. NPDC051011]|uniref:SDR family oxidoreductase n=1 Tax=Sphaerisporangium sp. NPDC051011 TaxID=3155792 RepID=UPI0033FF6441